MNVLFIVPNMFGSPAGIARYCALAARVLNRAPAVQRLDVVSLLDPCVGVADPRYLAGERYSFTGCGGDRVRFALTVLRAMTQTSYDLLLSGHVNHTPLLFAPLPRQRRAKRITFIYGTDVWQRLPWHRRWPLLRSDTAISISEYTAARATRANGLRGGKVRILYNCLDPHLASRDAAEEQPLGDDAPDAGSSAFGPNAILTVARFNRNEPGKGHDVVLRALPKVLCTVPDAQYYIVGEGDLRRDLEQLALRLGVADHVCFLGRLADSTLPRCYQMAKVFAMPSKQEGFGFVFLEAMAHGCAVIAGNRDAAPEVLGGGEAGVLVNPDDVDAVANAIVTLLTDEPLRGKVTRAARRRLEALFTYDRFRSTLLAHLERLW